jgi:signal transduction histidine kinase/CheY-like chemotaxis protein
MVYLVWKNRGDKRALILVTCGTFLLLVYRILELPFVGSFLDNAFGPGGAGFFYHAVNDSINDVGYCVFGLALVGLFVSVTRGIEKSHGREELLQRRERYLSCLAEVESALLVYRGGGNLYDEVLSKLGAVSGASRVYVFENSVDENGRLLMSQKSEWCAPGIHPEIDNPYLQNLPYADSFSHLQENLSRNVPVSGLVDEFPESERKVFEEENILSILLVPLFVEGRWFGFIGFDNCVESRVWEAPEVDLLHTAANSIALAIERVHAEEERLVLERKLLETQKLESLGLLAGGVAHDFNNLLTAILGNASLALDFTKEDSPCFQHLRNIETASERAAELANQMLAYSGRGKIVANTIQINQLIEEMGQLLAASIPKKVSVHLRLGSSIPTIDGDPTQIRQVLMNLLINASEAIGEASGTVSISTGVEEAAAGTIDVGHLGQTLRAGTYAKIEIRDDGCGMGMETQNKIFDPFFTTKFTGRGLGLAAVHGIVRGHGGSIHVKSQPGEGTVFSILLPAPLHLAEAVASRTIAEPAQGDGTILVVDDEEDVRDLVQTVLERAGYHVLTACDGIEGLDVFRAHCHLISAVLLDLSMPNMNGEETFKGLHRIRPDVPVILSSGFSESDIDGRFADKHPAGFIQKPYRPQTLLQVVASILAG